MTNPTAGADETRPDQEPLGTMLVGRGLITQDQLTEALAEQKASGEPLGKIVVARGFAAPATIAQALATQHGGLLKTEYGFATGFGSPLQSPVAISAPPAMISAPPVSSGAAKSAGARSAAVVAPAPVTPAAPAAPAESDSLRGELAHASAETERLRADNERLAQVRADLETRLAGEAQRASSLERELEVAKESVAKESGLAGGELAERLKEETHRVATLEAEVAARDAAIEEFKETGEGWKKAIADRDAAIAELVKARDEALSRAESVEPSVDVSALEAALAELEAERDVLQERLATAAAATVDTTALETTIDELKAERDALQERLAAAAAATVDTTALDAKLAELEAERDVLQERLAAAASAMVDATALEATIAELQVERDALQDRLEAALSATVDTTAIDAKLAELTTARDEALALLRTTKAELAERDAKLPAVTLERDTALTRIAQLEQAAEADQALLAVHDAAVADLLASHEAALDELRAEAAATTVDPWASAERHLLFFSGREGYELVERSGPPPAAGDRVEVPGGPQLVTRIAASPTPGRALPCAYLVAA
jgi:DNA repair exonuclease SbcCD ATPase subunit